MNKQKIKGFADLITIAIIFVAAVIFLGYFFYNNNQIKFISDPKITDNPFPSPSQLSTSDWNMHINQKLRYVFKYPPSWNFRSPKWGGEFHTLESSPLEYTTPEYTLSVNAWSRTLDTVEDHVNSTQYRRCIGNCPETGEGSEEKKEGIDYQFVNPKIEVKSTDKIPKYYYLTTAQDEKIVIIPYPDESKFVEFYPHTWPNKNYEIIDQIVSTFEFLEDNETFCYTNPRNSLNNFLDFLYKEEYGKAALLYDKNSPYISDFYPAEKMLMNHCRGYGTCISHTIIRENKKSENDYEYTVVFDSENNPYEFCGPEDNNPSTTPYCYTEVNFSVQKTDGCFINLDIPPITP